MRQSIRFFNHCKWHWVLKRENLENAMRKRELKNLRGVQSQLSLFKACDILIIQSILRIRWYHVSCWIHKTFRKFASCRNVCYSDFGGQRNNQRDNDNRLHKLPAGADVAGLSVVLFLFYRQPYDDAHTISAEALNYHESNSRGLLIQLWLRDVNVCW